MKKIFLVLALFVVFSGDAWAKSSEIGSSLGSIKLFEPQDINDSTDSEGDSKEDTNDKKGDVSFDGNGCDSYLGNPGTKGQPAYYLQFVFNLMKYAAIVLLFVMSGIEFGKAVFSNNQDAMKKAINNSVKRLIIAVIIFFLPILIEFLLKVVGVYSPDNCVIK